MTATKLLNDKKTVIGMDITLDDIQFASGNLDVSILLNGTEHIYGYGFIMTNNGIVMAHSNPNEQGKYYGTKSSPMFEIYNKIKHYTYSSSSYFEHIINKDKYAIFPRKLSNGWYVVSLTDLKDINDSFSEFSLAMLIGTILILIFAVIYSFFITISQIKTERLAKNLENALELAKRDRLTGLKNRTAYDIQITEFAKKINTDDDESFAIIMLDLNDLKFVNDNMGHSEGDKYINNSCSLIKKIIPTEIYRIGGDEFVLFLTDELFDKRFELLSELKNSVKEGNSLLTPNVEKPSIACGLSSHLAGKSDLLEDLVRQSDTKMYIDKAKIKQDRLISTKNQKD